MKKRRVTLEMDQTEAAVIAPIDHWDDLSAWYRMAAEEYPDKADQYYAVADDIDRQVEQTRHRRNSK